MSHPFKFTIDVCNTIWGQRISATYLRTYDGHWQWSLHKHASSQRDEDTSIHGLPDAAMPQFVVEACKSARLKWNDDEYARTSGFKP